jgi:hypothetical protein
LLFATVAYLAVAIWAYRAVLEDPSRLLPADVQAGGILADQSVALAQVARNADALLHDPAHFFDSFQCYPLPHSFTLGEHMFGNGLLAALPYAVSHDPVLSFNVLLILSVWIAGVTMYLFALEFLRSPPAAFVVGLLFALDPMRVYGVQHPFAYADMWTPAALLFLHRLFAHGGLANTLAFALFTSLEVLQSFYPLLWSSILLLAYALYLSFIHRRVLLARIPYLALALALLVGAVWIVLGPYLEARATWGLLSGRFSVPLPLSLAKFTNIAMVLGLAAMLDRWRGRRPRDGEDPRLCFFIAGLFLLWAAVGPVALPSLGIVMPSPRALMRVLIPGVDAVRGLWTLVLGTNLAVAFLAGYAVVAILERVRGRVGGVIVVALCAAIVVERLHGQLAPWVGKPPYMTTWRPRPPDEDLSLLRRTSGPTFHVPNDDLGNAAALRLVGYSLRPSSACYASFVSPLVPQLDRLAQQLPEPAAADALYALGFRTVLLHANRIALPDLRRFQRSVGSGPAGEHLKLVGKNTRIVAYDLSSRAPVSQDVALLAAAAGDADTSPVAQVSGDRASIDFEIVNAGPQVFRHPDPIAPSDLVVRWSLASGEVVSEQRTRAILPLALAPSSREPLALDLDVPGNPGRYVVSIAPAVTPQLIVARRTVEVGAVD